MNEYPKIPTLWMRDPSNPKRLLENQFATPELAYLANTQWEFTEKVDGTNIRLIFTTPNPHEQEPQIKVRGRTDNASIPAPLLESLHRRFIARSPDRDIRMREVVEIMREHDLTDLTLYGEGYGAGIQKGGIYRSTQDFIVFDVKVGSWWLNRGQVVETASRLYLDAVPVVGYGTLYDMVSIVRDGGFTSGLLGGKDYEGLVARPAVPMFDRKGERIIAKLKRKDFGS